MFSHFFDLSKTHFYYKCGKLFYSCGEDIDPFLIHTWENKFISLLAIAGITIGLLIAWVGLTAWFRET